MNEAFVKRFLKMVMQRRNSGLKDAERTGRDFRPDDETLQVAEAGKRAATVRIDLLADLTAERLKRERQSAH